jgi:hypothetical protein
VSSVGSQVNAEDGTNFVSANVELEWGVFLSFACRTSSNTPVGMRTCANDDNNSLCAFSSPFADVYSPLSPPSPLPPSVAAWRRFVGAASKHAIRPSIP